MHFKFSSILIRSVLFFIISICCLTNTQAQYTIPAISGGASNDQFYISNFTLDGVITLNGINNTTDNTENLYTLYSDTTFLNIGDTYTGNITYVAANNNTVGIRVWIDYSGDGTDFVDAGEEVFTFSGANPTSSSGITIPFTFTVPNTFGYTGASRIRVAIQHNNTGGFSPTTLDNQAGEFEDYDITIRPATTPPTAICQNISVELDIFGNATITPGQINNGSNDAVDSPADLTLALDKTNFTCNDLGDNTVTLTVTDTDGLIDTCTANVTITRYTGGFVSPVLQNINAFCEHTATAPILNFECRTLIVGTTTDPTTFTTDGNFTITWTFDNGTSTVTSVQNINVNTNPAAPTAVATSNIFENQATLSWNSTETGPFKIQFREVGTSTFTEINGITTTTHTLTGLNNDTDYEIQVSVDADCGNFSSLLPFTTLALGYCEGIPASALQITPSASYRITNTTLGTINNNSANATYTYFRGISTNAATGSTLTGSISYIKPTFNTSTLTIWIDFNQDGVFNETNEKVLFEDTGGIPQANINEAVSIPIPNSTRLGKTRIRVAISRGTPINSCDFAFLQTEIEDYDLIITPSTLESVLITEVVRSTDVEVNGNFIELKNTSTSTIPANTISLALFQNASGNLTGITPDATFTVNTPLNGEEVLLIQNSTATETNITGTSITNDAITDFISENDVLIVTATVDNTAWENRFDIITDITTNTGYVRNDYVTNNSSNFNNTEWTAFVSNTLNATRPLANGGALRLFDDPLLRIIDNTGNSTNANFHLGLHNIGPVESAGANAFNNGFPGRSRHVIINPGYTRNAGINAKSITIKNGAILSIQTGDLRVTDTVNIEFNAEIRLRRGTQLVQTHTGNSNVLGFGRLYTEQETDVASIFRYNYFSSPVNNLGSNVYNLSEILKDGTGGLLSTNIPNDINFIPGFNGSATNPISISNEWIYTFKNNGVSTSNFELQGATGSIGAIDGFTLKGPGVAQNYVFTGTPKDGTYNTTISGDQFYLVGNPYPSAIFTRRFIEDNLSSTDGFVYFWDHVGEDDATGINGHFASGYIGGYAVQGLTMAIPADGFTQNPTDPALGVPRIGGGTYKTPLDYIPVGQGFFVVGSATGGNILFRNSQRRALSIGSQSIFFKAQKLRTFNQQDNFDDDDNNYQELDDIDQENIEKQQVPLMKLGLDYTNEQDLKLHHQIGISFNSFNSFAYEPGYDAQSINDSNTTMNWKFENDDKRYVIAGVQSISESLEIPLEIKVDDKNSSIYLTIDEWQNIDRDVYLLDKLTEETKLLNNERVELNLDPATYTDRFAIAFRSNQTLSVEEKELKKVLISTRDKEILINNTGDSIVQEVEVYNILGKQLKEWNNFEDPKNIILDASTLDANIYIVKATTDKGATTLKVIL